MKLIPIDTSALSLIHVETVAKLRDGRQAENAERLPLWTVRALCTVNDAKPELVEITVALAREPGLPSLAPFETGGLVAREWSMGDRHGISLSATNVRPVAANGRKANAEPVAA